MVFGATALAAAFNLALAFWIFLGAVIYVGVTLSGSSPAPRSTLLLGAQLAVAPSLVGARR